MEFPWGIEKEASIYCISAQNALSQAGEATIRGIKDQAAAWSNLGVNTLPYERVIEEIVKYAVENNTQQGWAETDEEGMSWFLGIHSKAYDLACDSNSVGFGKIFKDAFIKHFSSVEDPTEKRLAAMKEWMNNQQGTPPCTIDPFSGEIKWNI